MDEASFYRYHLHVPTRHKDGKNLDFLVPTVRLLLNKAGLKGRHHLKDVEADWDDESHSVHIIVIDASNDTDTEQKIKDIAEQAKVMAEVDGVYLTRTPIDYWIL